MRSFESKGQVETSQQSEQSPPSSMLKSMDQIRTRINPGSLSGDNLSGRTSCISFCLFCVSDYKLGPDWAMCQNTISLHALKAPLHSPPPRPPTICSKFPAKLSQSFLSAVVHLPCQWTGHSTAGAASCPLSHGGRKSLRSKPSAAKQVHSTSHEMCEWLQLRGHLLLL